MVERIRLKKDGTPAKKPGPAPWVAATMKLNKRVSMMCTTGEAKAIRQAAREQGLTVSNWLHKLAVTAIAEVKGD